MILKKCVAEGIGTFALVFVGTGAAVVNEVTGGAVGLVGVALAFGLVVLAMIYAVGEVSGAHLNPAVTAAFWVAGRFPGRFVAPYLTSQLIGALIASGLLFWLLDGPGSLGATLPTAGVGPAFVLEVVLTFLLMFVILNVSTGSKEIGAQAGIAVGATVALAALFGGPLSGASMNPARSLAPALFAGHLDTVWIYLIAPPLGAVLAVAACRCVRNKGCCTVPLVEEIR